MGMQPVGYYDLTPAGVPVHSTAFRAVHEQALQTSPFRVFTSLLRLELIENPDLRAFAETALAKRSIAYFVLFDRATHDKLRRRVRYATSSCTYGWFRLLCADDLRVLEASRTSDYCALDHIPPALLDAARRRT